MNDDAVSERLEDKALELIERVEGLLAEHSGLAWEMAQAAVRAEAIVWLASSVTALALTLGVLAYAFRVWRKHEGECWDGEPLVVIGSVFVFVGFVAAFVHVIATPWVALFAPDLALVLRALK